MKKNRKIFKKLTYDKILEFIMYTFAGLVTVFTLHIFHGYKTEDFYCDVLIMLCAGLTVTLYEIGQYRYETLKELLTKKESEVTEHEKEMD